jgi:hypothetical protein
MSVIVLIDSLDALPEAVEDALVVRKVEIVLRAVDETEAVEDVVRVLAMEGVVLILGATE